MNLYMDEVELREEVPSELYRVVVTGVNKAFEAKEMEEKE